MKDFNENQLNKEENINEKNDSNNQCSNEFSDEKETKDDTNKEFTEENINKEKDKKVSNKNNKELEFSIENFRFKRYTMGDINKKFNDEIEKIKSNIRKFKSKIKKVKYRTYKVIKSEKFITLVVISLVFMCVVYINSDMRVFFKINNLSKNNSILCTEEVALDKYLNKILSKNDKEKTSKILDILNKQSTSNKFKVKVLSRVKDCNKESIDFFKIISLLGDPNNNDERINNGIIEILALNPKEENEKVFIKVYSPLINKDNKKLVQVFNKYKDNNIGTNDNIYKLDINTKDLVNSYILDILKTDDFKAFIKYKNNDETLKSFVDLSKEFINNDKDELLSKIPTKINESEIKITDNLKPQYENINLLINTMEELGKCKNDQKALEDNHKNPDYEKKITMDSIKELKDKINIKKEKLPSFVEKLNKVNSFIIEGYIIGENGETKTNYGNGCEYEVAYMQNTPYGKIPRKERFILNTYSTKFTNKGRFSLEVIYGGEREVRLKEEYGGFTQKWAIYDEYAGAVKGFYDNIEQSYENEKKEIENINKEIDRLNCKLEELDEYENNYNENMSSINNKIKELESKVIELKEGLTDNV